MIDLVFGGFGMLIRWLFVYKCNSKKMSEAYKLNTIEEGMKNNTAGYLLIPFVVIIGAIINYFVRT
ncbi:MAG: hypothetical protein K0M63_07640 [Weeksellaceae bacterium]|nr:hypothetical protein [Weeksellaceae bacterium]